MAITLVSHKLVTGPSPITSVGIDTTGATLLIVATADGGSSTITVSDNKANTWRALTFQEDGSNQSHSQLWYAYDKSGASLVVGSGHTITVTGLFPAASFQAWSGTKTSPTNPFDQQSGSNPGTGTAQPGSLTPAAANALIITGMAGHLGSTNTINSGFTLIDDAPFTGGTNYDGSFAYLVQGAAAAINPTWTCTGNPVVCTMATFLAAIATGGLLANSNLNGLGGSGSKTVRGM